MLLLALLACGSTLDIGGGVRPPRAQEGEDTNVGGTIGDAPEAPPDPEEPEFFDDSFIHTVAIELDEDAERSLSRNPYDYVEGHVTVDGYEFPRVGVRLRGKIGSFRDLDGKPKFKIDFNRYVADQRLGVHEQLALNNEVVDCSYLKEPVGYALFAQVGLPAPRTAYTRVTVNGEAYGLYVAVEFPDDTFLADRYADGGGNLYDGKYTYDSRGNYELIDFTTSQVENFQLEEGTDVGQADLLAIVDVVRGDATFNERMGPLVDLDVFHRHLAAEQWTGHLDGYALNTNNYRVYFDPEDGRADLLVYDLDYGFLEPATWGMNWATPQGVLAQACWYDAECAADHAAVVAEVVSTVDTAALLSRLDTWSALIAEAVDEDPRRECGRREVAPAQATVRAWVENGSANLAAFWSGE